jgi:hypothetical protein
MLVFLSCISCPLLFLKFYIWHVINLKDLLSRISFFHDVFIGLLHFLVFHEHDYHFIAPFHWCKKIEVSYVSEHGSF